MHTTIVGQHVLCMLQLTSRDQVGCHSLLMPVLEAVQVLESPPPVLKDLGQRGPCTTAACP